MRLHRFILRFYGTLFCLMFAFIFTAQVLSFLGLYRALLVFPLSLVVWAGAGWVYFRRDNGWLAAVSNPTPVSSVVNLHPFAVKGSSRVALLNSTLFATALFLLISVFLLRMVLFPYSSAGNIVPLDALYYHFVKAIELVRTGTMWDLAIPFGEYPAGYESLISAGILLTGSVYPAGIVHAAGLLLLVLTLYLLLCRLTALPAEGSLFLSVVLFFYPDLYSHALVIGKNDLFLSTLILAAVLHSPIFSPPLRLEKGPAAEVSNTTQTPFHPFGLAFATLMAMSVKPGGFLILAFLWLVVLIQSGQAYRQGSARKYLPLAWFVAAVVIMIPCGFWVIRNVAIMGRFVSPEVSSFFQGSIAASLTDPKLYHSGTDSAALTLLTAWLFILSGVIFLTRRFSLWLPLLLIVMWLAFFTTPLSAFHTIQRNILHIEWRYTTHTFLLMAVLCLSLAEPLLVKAYPLAMRIPTLSAGALITVCIGLLMVINPADLITFNPANAQRLHDLYPEPVGTDGYRSVYDYVQREVHHSVIIYNGAVPYYLYAPPYTNRILDVFPQPIGLPDLLPRPVPDYFVYLRPAWEDKNTFPEEALLMPPYHWEQIYNDDRGIVYHRRN